MAAGVEVADARSGVGRGEAAAIGMLAFAIVVWGCIGRVLAEASPYAQPLSLTMLRAVPTALLLLAALPILRYRLPSTREGWVWTSITGLLMVTWFLGALQMFTQSYVMTRGGPVNATKTLVYIMYEQAFSALNIGKASAIAVLLFGAVVFLSLLLRLLGAARQRVA